MITLHACLATSLVVGPCYVMPVLPPPLPEWATREWVRDAAGIVAGESVPGCDLCDLWIACTIVGDVTLRSYHPRQLRSGRWHGWREPRERHSMAIEEALSAGGCSQVPICAFLGSLNDYAGNWRFGLAQGELCYIIGNQHGAIICVP